jgi:hypothetical protein
MADPIKVKGLAEFNRNLRKLSADLPKELRLVLNEGANVIVDWAKPKIPSDSGAARATLKAKSTRTEARVQGGSTRVPYYPWLDFGGKVGRNRSIARPFYSDGRYIYAGLAATRDDVLETLTDGVVRLVEGAGLDVTHG